MQNQSLSPAALVKPADVAKRPSIGVNTLAKWRLSGSGPAYVKVGARVMYEEAAVDAWLASRVRRSTSDRGEAA